MDQVAPGITNIVSLIPPTREWPESSLAQMVEWIAEFWNVTYTTSSCLVNEIDDQPLILMGTGFHFVEAWEQGSLTPLGRGSVIFETGGTKGRTRSVTRSELYQFLQDGCRVSNEQIVSEYGMCELASQAYDWFRPGTQRQFRFPAWCKTFVRVNHELLADSGKGALCVYDSLRIDLPAVLSTEDVIELNTEGFHLIGRFKFSPLKGCSLNVENIAHTLDSKPSTIPHADSFTWSRLLSIEDRLDFLKKLLALPCWLELLHTESGSKSDAEWLWDNWRQSWVEHPDPISLVTAMSQKSKWLVISPRTHSLAALYPTLLGFLAGYHLVVRTSETTPLLKGICESLDNVKVVSDTAMIGADFSHGYDGIICFGETSTIDQIKQQVKIPLQGFGSGLALAYVELQDAYTKSLDIVHDAFALGQVGCRNIRGLLVAGDPQDFEILCESLTRTFRDYWIEPFTFNQTHHISQAMLSLDSLSQRQFRRDSQGPLFRLVSQLNPSTIMNVPFCLPIQFVADHAEAVSILKSFSQINLISSDKEFCVPGVETCPLGQAHFTKIDGIWQGQRFFDRDIFG